MQDWGWMTIMAYKGVAHVPQRLYSSVRLPLGLKYIQSLRIGWVFETEVKEEDITKDMIQHTSSEKGFEASSQLLHLGIFHLLIFAI